jgi:diadenosine tetraphosphate (Ap4A) HIT family hydrolase
MGSADVCPICEHGVPRDVLVDLDATWVTAGREGPLPGYVCIVSKVHVAEPFDLRGAGRWRFWEEVLLVAEAVQRVTRSPKLNYEIHGNTVPHLHLHLFPRYRGDPYEGHAIDPRTGPVFERSAADLAALRDGIVRAAGESN